MFLESVFYFMTLFLYFPPLAIGLGFLLHFFNKKSASGKSRTVNAAAALWILYGIYESYMSWIWSRKVAGPIRVDLLLIGPVLIILSLIAVVFLLKGPKRSSSAAN